MNKDHSDYIATIERTFHGRERENQSLLCRESKGSVNTPIKDIHTGHHSYGEYKTHNGHPCNSKDTFSATLNSHNTSGFVPKGVEIADRDFCNNLYSKERRDNNCNNLKYLTGGQVSSSPSGERNGAHSLERRMNTNGRGAMTRSSTPTTSSDSLSWMPPPPPPPPNTVRHQRAPIDHPAVVERPPPFVVNPNTNPVLFAHPLSPPDAPSRVLPPDPFQAPVYTSSTTPAGVYSPLPVYPPTTYPQYPHATSSLHHTGSLLPSSLLPPPEPSSVSYALLLRQMQQQHHPQLPQAPHRLGLPHPAPRTDSPGPYYPHPSHRTRPSLLDPHRHERTSPQYREDTDRRISPQQHHHHHPQHHSHRHHPSHPHHLSHRFAHPQTVVPVHSSVKTESSGIISQQGHFTASYVSGPSKYGQRYEAGGHQSTSAAASCSSEKPYLNKPSVKIDEPSPKISRKESGHSTTPPLHPVPECVPSTSSTSSSVTSAQSLPNPPSQPHYPPHFMKGSIIQLANGVLKRVEDLRTEDFVNSADISADLKIDSSQVVHIEEISERETAILGFSVGEQKIRVTVEATVEHPFFVFGQGWSSCNPEKTLKRYGLQCFKLVVGDICISLTQKQTMSPAPHGGGSTTTTTSGCNGQYPASSSQSRPSDTAAGGTTSLRQHPHQGSLLGSAESGRISGELSGHLHGSPPSVREGVAEEERGGSPITVGDAEIDSPFSVTGQSRKRRWSAPDQISGPEEGPIDVTDSSSSGTNKTPDNTPKSDQYPNT